MGLVIGTARDHMPGLKTENGVFSGEDGFKAAWVKDPEGNILSLEQLAGPWSEMPPNSA